MSIEEHSKPDEEKYTGIVTIKHFYPSATGKLLCVLLKPGDGELLTYVASGQGEHCRRAILHLTLLSTDAIYNINFSHVFCFGLLSRYNHT